MYRMEYTYLAAKGVEEVLTDTATTLDTARLWCTNIGPRNWGRYVIIDQASGEIMERGERNPLGVLYPERRCIACGAVIAQSGEHLCP